MTAPRHIELIDHIRNRPRMYVGETDQTGIFVMLPEIYYYYANQVLVGKFTHLDIVLHSDRSISMAGSAPSAKPPRIEANIPSRSIPSLMEDLVPLRENPDYYLGTMHAPFSIISTLCQWFEIRIRREQTEHRFRWERGQNVSSSPLMDAMRGDEVTIHWMPDPEIFGESQIAAESVERFLRTTGPLIREATHQFHDQRHSQPPVVYRFENGLTHLVEYMSSAYTPLGRTIRAVASQPDANGNAMEIEFALCFHREPGVSIMSAANLHFTNGGGPHADGAVEGFQRAMRSIDDYGFQRQQTTSGPGYVAAISVWLRKAQYFGPTKAELGNDEIREDIADFVDKSIQDHLAKDEVLTRTLRFT